MGDADAADWEEVVEDDWDVICIDGEAPQGDAGARTGGTLEFTLEEEGEGGWVCGCRSRAERQRPSH